MRRKQVGKERRNEGGKKSLNGYGWVIGDGRDYRIQFLKYLYKIMNANKNKF